MVVLLTKDLTWIMLLLESHKWEADEFPTELLMPEDEFKKQWDINHSMAYLAEFFNTSIGSTAVRIQKLGIDYASR